MEINKSSAVCLGDMVTALKAVEETLLKMGGRIYGSVEAATTIDQPHITVTIGFERLALHEYIVQFSGQQRNTD